jgi:RNA polymerase sigma factor (sigma-70 family)
MNHKRQSTDGPGLPTGAALFRQAQAGCQDSLAQLMAEHEGLVHAVVRKQVLGYLPFAEALQAGRIGLWHAILGFKPQKGLAFSTYAWKVIMHQVWREVKLAGRRQEQAAKHLPLEAISASEPPGAEDPALAWEANEIRCAVWELVARLPETLRIVIIARYGLTGKGRATWPQIGALLGYSRERARQWHWEALVWLGQPAHCQQLRSLLGRHTLADYEAVEAETQRWLRWRGGHHGR